MALHDLSVSLLHDIHDTLSLERDIHDELDLANFIGEGLPSSAAESLMRRGIPENDIYRYVIPKRTYQRRRANEEKLTPEESDKVERVARLLALATLVFDDKERAARWLSTPKRRFGNKAALELAVSSVGAKVVQETLLQAYFGQVA